MPSESETKILIAISENEMAHPSTIGPLTGVDEQETQDVMMTLAQSGHIRLGYGHVSLEAQGREVVRQIKRETERRAVEDQARRLW